MPISFGIGLLGWGSSAQCMTNLSTEILERVSRAREDFPTFVELLWTFSALKHQRKWFKELKRIVSGEITELLLVAPRGAGKSALVGILFLAWMIGNNPTKR